MKLVLDSYAKLNLYLKVLDKRRDNFHNLKTVFERISLSDKIVLETRPDKQIKIFSRSREIPLDHKNLAYRSAKLLQDACSVNSGVNIRIQKRIPVGSGMGGGSSNAAYVLLGLNKLWKLHLSRSKLVNFARRIGSDVPFFIFTAPFAVGEARGDVIEPLGSLKKIKLWHILVVPKLHVSTPLVYKLWDRLQVSQKKEDVRLTSPRDNVKILTLALLKKDFTLLASSLFNSLEQVTFKLYPELSLIKKKFSLLSVKSILMSGSGPAIFGILPSRKEAVSIARQLKRNKSWRTFVVHTV